MSEVQAPRWTRVLLRTMAPRGRADDVLGDLEEIYARRARRHGRLMAWLLTALYALDMTFALLRGRMRRRRSGEESAALRTRPGRRGPVFSCLDVKLGFRMLVKYPGLTVVGGLAIAFSIFVGASFFEVVTQVVRPSLPLEDGDRIVAVRLWDVAATREDFRVLHDFTRWRGQLRSIEELSAYRQIQRNLAIAGRGIEPIAVAEMTASAFTLTRVPPLLGRYLDAADERPGAPAVAVIGYDLWQERFAGDPNAVGQTVHLGEKATLVVGVMPEGFAFPVSHNLWTPLEPDPAGYAPRAGPGVRVFGRLVDGYGFAEARSELTTLGQQAAASSPDTHAQLRPQVVRYAETILELPIEEKLGLLGSNLFVIMLLVLVCGNVALLMFARAATRENEMVVRNALGAGRSRIVTQLFTEALVLGSVGAALGLAATGYGIRLVLGFVERGGVMGQLPFWFRDTLSPWTIAYAGALTVLGAVIAGVVPALKVTGTGVEGRLRRAAAGGGHARLGGIWTLVIVSQVAVTVATPATGYFVRKGLDWERSFDFGFPAAEYLAVELRLPAEPHPGMPPLTREEFIGRFAAVATDLQARLALEPGIVQTAFSDRLPGSYHRWVRIELDAGAVAARDERGHRVGSAQVDPGYFDALGASVVLGRGFAEGDLDSEHRVVVVNEAFVDQVLGGANPIGRRLRYVARDLDTMTGAEPGPWHEIVGVVPYLGMHNSNWGSMGVYHPIRPGGLHPLYMTVRVAGDADAFGSRLREVAAAVNPALQLHNLIRLDEVRAENITLFEFWYRVVLMVSAVALFLALAGIYAVMAFTVSRRTREIGIRVALGSDRKRVALAIFRRPLAQVSLGILVGVAWTAFLADIGIHGPSGGIGEGLFTPEAAAMVAGYALLMIGVCLLSCIVPARRALAVEPTVALKADV